jgi:hypothetical protein
MEHFFRQLETYIEVSQTTSMKDIIENVMVAVLSILAILTEGIRPGRASELVQGTYIVFYSPFIRKVLEEDSGED